MRYRFIFTWLFTCICWMVFAQQPTGYQVQYFNTDNGLPSNGIKGLQWDGQTGFLWIATEAGIVRYNGLEFKNYTKEDNSQISTGRNLFLIKNNRGKIYTADSYGNIFHVAANRLAFSHNETIIGNNQTNIIALAVSDTLKKTKLVNTTNSPFALQFDHLLPDGDTAAFIIHNSNLYRYSVSFATPRLIPFDAINFRMGFKTGNEFFLVDNSNKVYLLDKNNYLLKRVIISGAGNADNQIIWNNGMQHPVLFNHEKAWTLHFNGKELTGEMICDQVPTGILIRFVQYDAQKRILFLGTDSKGILILKQNQVVSVKKEQVNLNERTSYYSQIEMSGGRILTNEGHVIGNPQQVNTALPVTGKFLPAIITSGDSVLWYSKMDTASGKNCLHKYSYTTNRTIAYTKISTGYQTILFESGKKLYLVNEAGIRVMQQDTAITLYRHPQDGIERLHYSMCEWGDGKLAIATCNALLQFNIKDNTLDTLYNDGNYCVRSLWPYKDYLFFGTYGDGLFILKKGVVKPLPLDKNRFLLYTHCFVKDDSGYCWISTNKGLFKARLDEMTDAYEKNSPSVYYHYFGRNDGMEMTELNGGCTPCAITLKDKTISFPSMDGLLWVNPGTTHPAMPEGEIFIDGIIADDKIFNPDSAAQLEFPAKTTELVFNLGFSAWSNFENIYLEYQLNEDGIWRPVNIGKGSAISFNNLAPGKYKLVIRKRNGFGAGNYSQKELNFYVKVPWFKQWWFNLMIVGVIAGLFMVFYNYRTQQMRTNQLKLEKQVADKTSELQQQNELLEKNDTIKTRLISIISHDIVTPLKFITVAGKNLIENKSRMNEGLQQETIKEMVNTTQELQLLTTNILNWIKYQNENRRLAKENFMVHELVQQVFGVLNSLARQKGLVLKNETAPELKIYQFFEPLKILIFNLISNAINFTEEGTIIAGTNEKGNTVEVFVKDEGVGMTPEQIQNIMADQFIVSSANIDNRKGNGLGYLIIKDLVKMMGATLHIESEKGKGTKVSVFIPVNQGS